MQTREDFLNGLAEIAALLTAAAAITQRVYTGLANGDHGAPCQSREHPGSFGGANAIRRLLGNAAVVRYLSREEPAMLAEFQKIAEASDLRAAG